jgi:hypothetical protein
MEKREEEIFRAIHHDSVSDFFGSLGLSEKLAQGKIHCIICDEIITLENFRAVARKSGNFLFCCNKESCILELALILRSTEL